MKLLNYFRNRTVLGITCIVLSILICFVISPLISKGNTKTTTIVRVLSDMKSGDKITKDKIKEEKTLGNQPNTLIKDKNQVLDKYAKMDMIKDDIILIDKISETPYIENTYLSGLDGTKRAISITLRNFADGLSGKLKSGDIVSVIAPMYKGITSIPKELQYVEVIAVTSKTGTDTDKENIDKELPSTVTLLVTEKQSKILSELEYDGNIHLSLVYRGNSENSKKFIDAQDNLESEAETND